MDGDNGFSTTETAAHHGRMIGLAATLRGLAIALAAVAPLAAFAADIATARAPLRLRLHGARDCGDAGRRHRQSRHAGGARRRSAVEPRRRRGRQVLRRLSRRRGAQHERRRGALSGLRPALGRPVDLEQRINLCRDRASEGDAAAVREQGAAGADRLCRASVAGHADRDPPTIRRLRHFIDAGRDIFERRQGQLNLSCAQCHDDNWGKNSPAR